jgi:hypothetical protein
MLSAVPWPPFGSPSVTVAHIPQHRYLELEPVSTLKHSRRPAARAQQSASSGILSFTSKTAVSVQTSSLSVSHSSVRTSLHKFETRGQAGTTMFQGSCGFSDGKSVKSRAREPKGTLGGVSNRQFRFDLRRCQYSFSLISGKHCIVRIPGYLYGARAAILRRLHSDRLRGLAGRNAPLSIPSGGSPRV